MAASTLSTTSAAPRWPLARASGSGQSRAHAHTKRRGRRQCRRPLRVRSGVVHADTYIGLYAYAGGEATDASDPHHPRSPHPSGAYGTSSGTEVQQGQYRGQSTGDEGGVPPVPAETGEAEAKRALGKRVLRSNKVQADSMGFLHFLYCPALHRESKQS